MVKKLSLLDVILERLLDIAAGTYEPKDEALPHLRLYSGILEVSDLTDVDKMRVEMALGQAFGRLEPKHKLARAFFSDIGVGPLSKETEEALELIDGNIRNARGKLATTIVGSESKEGGNTPPKVKAPNKYDYLKKI